VAGDRPGARSVRLTLTRVRYQACASPQCGQPTVVETLASKTHPQVHW